MSPPVQGADAPPARRFILVSGIPRAGSSWLMRQVGSLLSHAGLPAAAGTAAGADRDDDYPSNARGDAEDLRLRAALAAFSAGGTGIRRAKTHYYPGSALTAADCFRVLWIWRDLRDVMASTCHYALAGPAAGVFGAMPRQEAFDRVIGMTLPVALAALRHVSAATLPATSLVVRYERLLADPEATLVQINRHLALPLAAAQLRRVAADHGFARESGRQPGVEDRDSYYRIGTAGNWRQTLPRRQQQLIDSMAPGLDALQEAVRERYG